MFVVGYFVKGMRPLCWELGFELGQGLSIRVTSDDYVCDFGNCYTVVQNRNLIHYSRSLVPS